MGEVEMVLAETREEVALEEATAVTTEVVAVVAAAVVQVEEDAAGRLGVGAGQAAVAQSHLGALAKEGVEIWAEAVRVAEETGAEARVEEAEEVEAATRVGAMAAPAG